MRLSVCDAGDDRRRHFGVTVDRAAVLSGGRKSSFAAAERRHHSMTSLDSRRSSGTEWRGDDARDDVIATTPPQVRGGAAEETSVLRVDATSWLPASPPQQQQQQQQPQWLDDVQRGARSTPYTALSDAPRGLSHADYTRQPALMSSGTGSSVVVVVGNPVEIVTRTRSVNDSFVCRHSLRRVSKNVPALGFAITLTHVNGF